MAMSPPLSFGREHSLHLAFISLTRGNRNNHCSMFMWSFVLFRPTQGCDFSITKFDVRLVCRKCFAQLKQLCGTFAQMHFHQF